MKNKDDYKKELVTLDGIKKCVLRYAHFVSKEDSEWYKEYMEYLRKRERKIENKLCKLERQG